MHSLDLSFDMNNGKSSDREKVNFGIREVTSELMKNGEEDEDSGAPAHQQD